MSVKPVQYDSTAWDSTQPRDLPPLDEERLGAIQRAVRRYPLRGRGVQCREFLAGTQPRLVIEWLREMKGQEDAELQAELKKNPTISETWATLKNPKAVLEVVSKVAIFFAIGGGVGGIIMGLITGGFKDFTLWAWQYFSLPFLFIYFISKTAIKRGWVKDKNNIVLNRCTGMVEFMYEKKRREIPFDEFDAYMSTGVGPNGVAHYYLRLVHRYSDVSVASPHSRYEPWELEGDWERLQQFMDISMPLPDEPSLEIARRIDPTTIEYDRKTGRPPDFWASQDPEEVARWADASRKALERFPWGLTRQQAIAAGWRPSGYGEGEQIWKQWPKKHGKRIPPQKVNEAVVEA